MIIKAETYDIIVENGCLKKAGEYLDLNRRALVMTDDGVPDEYSKAVLKACGVGSRIMKIKQGEASKSFDILQAVLKVLMSAGFTRGDCVIAVGGGVVGDLSGFAASIYMRGIDFYNIPTTVLSQVDSSIGGKTAIDFCGVKNSIGSFWQPKRVLIDESVLSTLPERQINNGLAEALKMSMTNDAELFEIFENADPYEHIEEIIIKSLIIKNSVVTEDEREAGLRRVLNFGHTIGHGIESQSAENGLYHGECVALGIIPMCGESVRARLIPVLKKLSLPVSCYGNTDKIYSAMLHDKKMNDSGITVSVVNEIGTFEFKSISPQTLRDKISMVVKGEKQI